MGELLILILICVAVYWGVKKKGQRKDRITNDALVKAAAATAPVSPAPNPTRPTPGVNRVPADALINSPYYSKYETAFGLIWYDGKQPKYKIDWLLESLNMGRELEDDGYYVLESMRKGLPYFCETEREFDRFSLDGGEPVLKGSVDGILGLIFLYSTGDCAHPSKLRYWVQTLQEMAISGNFDAQGALCSNSTYVQTAFTEEERDAFKLKYEKPLHTLADAGNPQAQLAIGKRLTPFGSQESIDWITKAANQGLGDAWYFLGEAYRHSFHIDENGSFRWQLPQEEMRKMTNIQDECRLKAANANNGIMAGYCQHYIGTKYEEGDSIFPKDLEKAKLWHQKAIENGYELSERSLNDLNEHPEWF